jgi:hypothetical protein
MSPAEREVAWWLSIEPLGSDAVWALTRVADGRPPDGPLGAGLLPAVGFVEQMVRAALPVGGDREGPRWTGPLVDRAAERELACAVGRVLLPYALRKELLNAPRGQWHTVSVAVRGWLAQVPWDALAVDDAGDRRLVECATVVAGLPATLHVGRARLPDRGADGPVLRVADPGPPEKDRLLPQGPGSWYDLCVGDEYIEDAPFGRQELGERLRERPARLVYYGHAVPGADEAPAAAGLLLSGRGGRADVFTAFDWLAEPALYPAPPRVAVIACGSDDSTLFEQSGIPVAAINAGAELLTATRWILPVDQTRKDDCPTMALGMAVDRAHAAADPLAAVRRWQLERLGDWRARGEIADTPLLWASLVTYLAPGRPAP